MEFLLDSIPVRLVYTDPDISAILDLLFRGWPVVWNRSHSCYSEPKNHPKPASVCFYLEIQDQPPEKPAGRPRFQDVIHTLIETKGFLSLYQVQDEIILYFEDGVMVRLPRLEELDSGEIEIHANLSREVLHASRLEDIIFAGLAPFLRRQGYYLVHGFGATSNHGATLIIGPSNSGKTTAGLGLLMAGWGYLANDVVLLKREVDGIYALPTPGAVGMTAMTIRMLPDLQRRMKHNSGQDFFGKVYSAVTDFVTGWSKPARVNMICHPQIRHGQSTELIKANQAMILAWLLESSVDRWDAPELDNHIKFLEELVEQAAVYILESGQQIDAWPALI